MAIPTFSFLAGSLVFAYLLTFVLFAVIRVFTGISIQRLGFSSLRHITYAPRDGFKLEIRGLGLQVHRPSFAQPTWLSLVVEELKITLDLAALGAAQSDKQEEIKSSNDNGERPKLQARLSSALRGSKLPEKSKNKLWAKLTDIKNKLKKLQSIISWLRLIDVVAKRSSCVVDGIGTVQVGTVLVSVDTRPATVDRSRLFQHNKTHLGEQWPAEWTFGMRSILFTPNNKDAIEILDHCILNIHGYLRPKVEGLRDASVSLKLGRLHIPYDDFHSSSRLAKHGLRKLDTGRQRSFSPDSDNIAESDDEESSLPQMISDAKDFVSSTLRGIREFTVAVGFLGLSNRIDSVHPAGSPLYLNASMKEVGVDLYRLDPSTPAHSMYFSKGEVAHQALITAISVSLGMDSGHDHPERLLYIPMTTATIRTTLPAKIVQAFSQEGLLDLNSNVLFANLVVTSPSMDLDPAHLPIILAALQGRPKASSRSRRRFGLPARLLPRAVIRLSMHEPVIRVSLPPVQTRKPEDFDFDLLISAISSISIDLDSSHHTASDEKYNAVLNLRVSAHRLYYQTTSRETHDLLISDSVDVKVQITSNPQLMVAVTAGIDTFSLFMIRPEIGEGLRQIVHQLRSDVQTKKLKKPKTSKDPNFMRALPSWMQHIGLQASDVNLEVAGVDPRLSSHSRGFAFHLDAWSMEYKMHKDDVPKKPAHRRRGGSQSAKNESDTDRTSSPSSRARPSADPTDGRRVAVHMKGFEGYIIESASMWEQEPSLSIPRAEVSLTTSNDGQGPVLHVNSHIKSLFAQYSLFRHYAVGVAVVTLRKILSRAHTHVASRVPTEGAQSEVPEQALISPSGKASPEFVSVDVRLAFAQVKAQLPDDPNTMLHLASVEAGRHRWHTPFVRASVARLFAQTPSVKNAWSRVVSIKSSRVDFRQLRRKQGSGTKVERSIDVVAETIRIGVPHQLVVHKIFDNFTNTAKTVAQLHHRFNTDSDEYILQKVPEGPKHVPKLSIRSQIFLFELEDGPFEWKLGCIFRAGLVEQKQRIAREEAFQVKCKKIRQMSSRPSHARSRSQDSTRGRERSDQEPRRTSSPQTRRRLASQPDADGQRMRYDKDGSHGMSGFAQRTAEEAWIKLQEHNAQSWRKRVDHAMSFQRNAVQDIRDLLWGLEDVPEHGDKKETIMQMPHRPALAAILMSDLTITIDKPSFPIDELPDFMCRVGKGLPKDTKFSMLIPLHAHFECGELRATLRDYPLPLMHFPAIKPGQSAKLPSWSLRTDFVIAEEFRDFESTRDLKIMVIPADKLQGGDKKSGGFAVDVRRTVSPVKTYSDIKLDIHTARDSKFTWGNSYQPAIQDTMQVLEGFTKAQVDTSDKVGFWDKIRLSFHSRINVSWVGGGDVHLMLKGSRDPYVVTGHGAGFIMIWRNNVRWSLGQSDDPGKFMTVDSGDYVLAVPDLSNYARRASGNSTPSRPYVGENVQTFKKVIMKLSGKVRWLIGLVFERNLEGGGRSFEFEPHYNVTLKNPVHVKDLLRDNHYDAFRGFRSNHIHMSIAVSAPSDREWSVTNLEPASNYNSVHLSPKFFTHFFAWWDLFSGVMSLPVRQGALFPGIEKSGKKFGRHLATIKYSILLSPLFISHVYIHKDGDEFADDRVSSTGLKVRLDSFMVDIHQRREELTSEVKGLNKQVKTTGMRIYEALVDLIKADMRAVSVVMTGTSYEAVDNATPEELRAMSRDYDQRPVNLASFKIPDSDLSWIDVDDFVEIGWTLPHLNDPETSILPLAFSPRFTYRRQTDHGDNIQGDTHRHSPFGYEQTHYCVMSSANDSRIVQKDLIKKRLDQIDGLLDDHSRAIGEQELHVVRELDDQEAIKKELRELHEHGDKFGKKQAFLAAMIDNLEYRIEADGLQPDVAIDNFGNSSSRKDRRLSSKQDTESRSDRQSTQEKGDDLKSGILTDHVSDFNNRFVVHNAQIKWNNSLRNTMLRYIHQVSQRRGFVYYTSRRAVKFILDIIEEQNKASKQQSKESEQISDNSSPQIHNGGEDEAGVQERIKQLLDDGKRFVNAEDTEATDASKTASSKSHHHSDEVSHDFIPQNTYHVRLVAPQIQLQSEKNPKSVVLLAARGMRLQVIQIMDKDRISDDVSGLVQTRYSVEMDNMQFFVTSKQMLSTKFLKLYSTNSYGTATGSQWPPWAPMEAMFDFKNDTYGFERVVQRTSASLRYDKFNKLRLKYNDSVTDGKGQASQAAESESRMDQLWVDFPQLHALCDSASYYSIYIIVLDLLMWNEPLEKTRSERLEKLMLASDSSDLRGAPEMVIMLQERIRALEEIKTHFHINEKFLDHQGWHDRIAMEQDLASCEDELFFMMKAITTSQRKYDDRSNPSQSSGILRYHLAATEVVWHLLREAGQPLAEFQLRRAVFERVDNSDGSNHNSVDIDQIKVLSLLPNAIYPETISAYTDHLGSGGKISSEKSRMVHVKWYRLEAIAGINVIDHFEVNMHPLKIQLEYETGRKLFEYVFPGSGSGEEGFSPFMVKNKLPGPEDDDDDDPDATQNHRESILQATKDHPLGGATGAGSLEHRLQPTRALPDYNRAGSYHGKDQGLGLTIPATSRLNMLRRHSASNSKSSLASSIKTTNASTDNLSTSVRGRDVVRTSTMTNNTTNGSDTSHRRRFGLTKNKRDSSTESKKSKATPKDSDDLTQMLNRASNYMTLSYVKIPSVVLCLSYKGRGTRNFEDVHNLVFRMPTLEYRNKTWSNLDLALQLKKDVIRALISHTGAIIGNKFSHHKYNKHQQSRLRELASSSALLSSADVSHAPSANSSVRNLTMVDDEASPRRSDVTDYTADLSHTDSFASGLSDYGHHTPSIREEEGDEFPSADEAETTNLRTTFTRHFSELTQKAIRRTTTGVSGDDGHGGGSEVNNAGEQSTPRKGKLVKKLLHSLDR